MFVSLIQSKGRIYIPVKFNAPSVASAKNNTYAIGKVEINIEINMTRSGVRLTFSGINHLPHNEKKRP